MKKLICLMFVSLVILFSCSKDILTDENPELKRAKVPVPMKVTMCATEDINVARIPVANTPVVDPSSGNVLIPALTLVGASFLSGQGTHIGELDMEHSIMTGKDAYLDLGILFTEHKVILKATYDVILTGANGDYFTSVTHISIDATDQNQSIITGDWTINGGSGKFENAAGCGTFGGVIPCWSCEGTLEYPR